eukprot:TRINITY_DN33013_c0_g1_i1.p1 TRINITY_DN33013_c0_g1~~TRINITY_DN33013_c0_g1_i1.p1  ORF type:complete len:359 (+),score=22.22 TRINITY_DN33013_c0_g1_i1:97-1173(+)
MSLTNFDCGEGDIQRQHNAWLASADDEQVLDPEIPIIDAHHHMWYKLSSRPYCANYMIEELSHDISESGHNIVATVYMQSTRAGWRRSDGPDAFRVVGETELMQGMAVLGESGLYTPARVCAAIVGTADLALGGEVEGVLRAHMSVARNFRGVRFLGGRAEQIPFRAPGFREGIAVMQRLGLVLDCNGPETHPLDFEGVLGPLTELAREFPRLTVVLNHCGGAVGPRCFEHDPDKQFEWERCLQRLATCPNVMVKIGGLQMEINGFGLDGEHRKTPIGSEELVRLTFPFYSFVINTFGPRRCMFESNFPVDRQGVSYRVLWNAFKRIASDMKLSEADRHSLFCGTAARVYRIDQETLL